MTVLITGAAGFIGAHLVLKLLQGSGPLQIVGFDNLNDYYDVRLKHYRLRKIAESAGQHPGHRWTFIEGNLADRDALDRVFTAYRPSVVVNLAAQAGVRHSITRPDDYIETNIVGFYRLLEACRHSHDNGQGGVQHLVFASSSSVYGDNEKMPYSTEDPTDRPVSLYAATKKSDELMAHAYAKLYNIPTTGLRFFTVYGPAGRPDMAYYRFTDSLRRRETIELYNYGRCRRDFIYIDDLTDALQRILRQPPGQQTGADGLPEAPYALYNIGNGHPESLLHFVTVLQQELVRAHLLPEDYDFEAHRKLVAMQPGDVAVTYADTTALQRDFGFRPSTPLQEGLRKFAEWYKTYHLSVSS